MEPITALVFLSAYYFLLGFGSIIADYVLPRIPFLVRYIDALTDWEDDAETSAEM